jgi:Glycosyl hydrolase 108/Predicted Peptidoglycan domain
MVEVLRMIEDLIGREGGYVDHPADRGGPTRWGVTQAVAREHGYRGDMKDFPRGLAIEIYREDYWRRPGFELLSKDAPELAEKLFDIGVNMGPRIAIRFLVRALNALSRGQKAFVEIDPPATVSEAVRGALGVYLTRRGQAGEDVLLTAVRGLQVERYIGLVERRPANAAFLYGWLANRIG